MPKEELHDTKTLRLILQKPPYQNHNPISCAVDKIHIPLQSIRLIIRCFGALVSLREINKNRNHKIVVALLG